MMKYKTIFIIITLCFASTIFCFTTNASAEEKDSLLECSGKAVGKWGGCLLNKGKVIVSSSTSKNPAPKGQQILDYNKDCTGEALKDVQDCVNKATTAEFKILKKLQN